MAQYGFFFDNDRCTGCKTCVLACKDYNNLSARISFRKVYDIEGGTCQIAEDGTLHTDAFAYHLSLACNHCSRPACAHVCPTTAMHKEPETGLVWVDPAKCIGCGYCTMACPYHAPAISDETDKSAKCDGCRSRLLAGLKPICVESCPVRALDFAPMGELEARHGNTLPAIPPMPEAALTGANIIIKPSPNARSESAHEGFAVNVAENNYVRM